MHTQDNIFFNALLQNKTAPQAARAAGWPKEQAQRNATALLTSLTFQLTYREALEEANQRREHLLKCLASMQELACDPTATNKERLQASSQVLRLESTLRKLPYSLQIQTEESTQSTQPIPDSIKEGTPSKDGESAPLPVGEGLGVGPSQVTQPASHETETPPTPDPIKETTASATDTETPFNPLTYVFKPNEGAVRYQDAQGANWIHYNPNPQTSPAPATPQEEEGDDTRSPYRFPDHLYDDDNNFIG